jgi:hypothetical protein
MKIGTKIVADDKSSVCKSGKNSHVHNLARNEEGGRGWGGGVYTPFFWHASSPAKTTDIRNVLKGNTIVKHDMFSHVTPS